MSTQKQLSVSSARKVLHQKRKNKVLHLFEDHLLSYINYGDMNAIKSFRFDLVGGIEGKIKEFTPLTAALFYGKPEIAEYFILNLGADVIFFRICSPCFIFTERARTFSVPTGLNLFTIEKFRVDGVGHTRQLTSIGQIL